MRKTSNVVSTLLLLGSVGSLSYLRRQLRGLSLPFDLLGEEDYSYC